MRGTSIIVLLCVAVLTLVIAPAAFAAAIDVTDISPDGGNTGETVHCTVYGVFNPVAFQTGEPQFTLSRGLTTIYGVTTWFGGFPFQHADVRFAIPDSATLGWYDLEAEQQEGATHWSDILLNAFYVDEYPVIDWVDPEALVAGTMYRTIVVHGRHFYSVPRVGDPCEPPGTGDHVPFVAAALGGDPRVHARLARAAARRSAEPGAPAGR